MRTPVVILGTLCLALLGLVAHAEEQAVPKPIEAHLPYAKASKLHVAADLVRGGRATARFVAAVEPSPGGFAITETIRYADPKAGEVHTEVFTDEHLFARTGRYERRNESGFLKAWWYRGKAGAPGVVLADAPYQIHYTTQDYENEIEAPVGASARSSLAAVLYIASRAPREKRVFSWHDFDPDPWGGDRYVAEARFECHGKAAWRVDEVIRDAWIYSYTRGKRTYRLALDAESCAFRGLEVLGMGLALAPVGARAVGPADESAAGLSTPIERARRRALAIRAERAAPATGWRFEGELLLGEFKLGRVSLRMEPTSVDGEPAWLVTERTVRKAGAARVVHELTVFLAPDLSLLRGETLHDAPEGRSSSTFERSGSAMVTRQRVRGKAADPIAQPLRADATLSLCAVVSFLRDVPAESATYVLSGFDPRYVTTPKAGSGGFPQDVADAFVEVAGKSVYSNGVRLFKTLSARVSTKTGRRHTIHVDRKTRALVAVVGGLPSTTIAPKGTPGRAPDFFNTDREPTSAYEAFIRFGRGYHLPREDYLAKAFHWERMLFHDVKAGTYPTDTKLKVYRRDWIAEFVKRSKHRTLGDCDDLLLQILMTSKETHQEDGGLTIATLPVYGGHVYRMQQVDGRWFITQID